MVVYRSPLLKTNFAMENDVFKVQCLCPTMVFIILDNFVGKRLTQISKILDYGTGGA